MNIVDAVKLLFEGLPEVSGYIQHQLSEGDWERWEESVETVEELVEGAFGLTVDSFK